MTTSNSKNVQKEFGHRLRQIRQNIGLVVVTLYFLPEILTKQLKKPKMMDINVFQLS